MLALNALSDRPAEILRTAMIRAKMCELLAEAARVKPIESFFTVGLITALDPIMQRPLPKLLGEYRGGDLGELYYRYLVMHSMTPADAWRG